MSRSTGNEMEYLVSKCIIRMGFKPAKDGYTTHRLDAIRAKVTGANKNKKLEDKICQGLVCILPPTVCTFSLMRDTHGSSTSITRSTSDIVINSQPPVNISIKHNNSSLKHQKAGNLWSQMRMCPSRKQRFVEAYDKITSAWYEKVMVDAAVLKSKKAKAPTTYAELPTQAKQDLYDAVNSLILKNLVTAPQKDARGFLDFILDLPTQNKYILRCDKVKTRVRVMQLCVPADAPVSKIARKGNFIEMQLGETVTVRMRLHTCKNHLTPKPALKYDTQLKGGLVDVVSL